jgi:acetolactate synthase-1/2/3 large subunit
MDANDDAVADRLRRFAEAHSVPVMVSPKAKGVFREDHPLFLGTIEGLGTAFLFDYIDTCDLVLMVGFDPVEFDRDWAARARIVHIGPLPNDDRYYGSEVELVGPIDVALDRVHAASDPVPKLTADEVRAFRDAFLARVRPSSSRLTSQEVLAELRAKLPENALVTTDVGFNKAVSSQCWPAYRPRTFFVSNGLSSMGYGLPSALALKLQHPDRAVACVIGDGGFAMSMAELETGVRSGLGVLVVVLADDALSQIKAGQERKGYPVTGTTFGSLDYVKLAAAFGARGLEVSDVAGCRTAFDTSPGDRPLVVAAHVDPGAYRLA